MKVLLVDDERKFAMMLSRRLALREIDVDYAFSGEAALEKARVNRYDIAILDVTMPKERGLQMYRALKEHEDLENIPVILVSDIDKKTFSFYQRFQGMPRRKGLPDPVAYLEKPLETERLIKLVRTLTKTDECPVTEDD